MHFDNESVKMTTYLPIQKEEAACVAASHFATSQKPSSKYGLYPLQVVLQSANQPPSLPHLGIHLEYWDRTPKRPTDVQVLYSIQLACLQDHINIRHHSSMDDTIRVDDLLTTCYSY